MDRRAARRPSRSRTLFAEPRKEPEANASIAVPHGPLMLAFCLGGSPCNTLPRGEPPLMQPEQLGIFRLPIRLSLINPAAGSRIPPCAATLLTLLRFDI